MNPLGKLLRIISLLVLPIVLAACTSFLLQYYPPKPGSVIHSICDETINWGVTSNGVREGRLVECHCYHSGGYIFRSLVLLPKDIVSESPYRVELRVGVESKQYNQSTLSEFRKLVPATTLSVHCKPSRN